MEKVNTSYTKLNWGKVSELLHINFKIYDGKEVKNFEAKDYLFAKPLVISIKTKSVEILYTRKQAYILAENKETKDIFKKK